MSGYRVDEADWRNPGDYAYSEGFDGAQWAWQFLRRNPSYQREWQAFISVWRALEQDYGRAPNRDFCQWKNDPRAWVPAAACSDGDCRIDQDKVLIECALGARWGFHKFPPDPRIRDAPGEGLLSWREQPLEMALWEAGAPPADPVHATLVFDLELPLKAQIEQAKRLLQLEQRQRVREGLIHAPRAAAHAAGWRQAIRLLDAQASGASREEMKACWPDDDIAARLAEAGCLRDGGYRRLTLLP